MMAALAVGNVGIVATLTSTTPVLILPLIWIVTGKAPPCRGGSGPGSPCWEPGLSVWAHEKGPPKRAFSISIIAF